jgi:hypothetical protein
VTWQPKQKEEDGFECNPVSLKPHNPKNSPNDQNTIFSNDQNTMFWKIVVLLGPVHLRVGCLFIYVFII